MKLHEVFTHPWQVTRTEAAAIQRCLARSVLLRPLPSKGPGSPNLAAGVDVAYVKDGSCAWAAVVVMDRHFRIRATSVVAGTPDSAYEHGYLAFREGRLCVEALLGLDVTPDVVFFDGHGSVHERGCGLASHIGVLLEIPTIGVAKTPFYAINRMPGPNRGDHYVFTNERGAQGASVRLKAHIKPVYVSPGHLTDLPSALALALAWSSGQHRVPDPLSAAHSLSLCARNTATPPCLPHTAS